MWESNNSGDIFQDSIDYEGLWLVEDKINQIEGEIEYLEQKKKILKSTRDQSDLDDIDKRLRLLAGRLRRFERECDDILEYWGGSAL